MAAVVITEQDSDVLKNEMIGAFKIPVMLIKDADSHVSDEIIKQVYRVIDLNETDHDFYSRQIESAAAHYEENVLPPFFKDLEKYVENGYSQFDCPATKAVLSFVNIRQAALFTISSVRIHSAPISAMRMSHWVISSFMKVLLCPHKNMQPVYTMPTKHISY